MDFIENRALALFFLTSTKHGLTPWHKIQMREVHTRTYAHTNIYDSKILRKYTYRRLGSTLFSFLFCLRC